MTASLPCVPIGDGGRPAAPNPSCSITPTAGSTSQIAAVDLKFSMAELGVDRLVIAVRAKELDAARAELARFGAEVIVRTEAL